MLSEKHRQRIEALFSDIERLAADPCRNTPAIRCELDELRARLCELEAQFLESEKRAVERENTPTLDIMKADANEGWTRPVAPILYEKEHVGYVYAGDGVKPLQAPLPSLPETTDTIIAPLTASGQTIGRMQIEPAPEHPWTMEEANLLNAVAQQASLQIQNLRLLATTERARAEAEAATRRFMHENWDSYLDAIHHSERVGYAYDQAAVTPFIGPARVDGGILESVTVMDEQVGTLYLTPDPARPLTNDDKALVSAIARQIAQQVENLRLLADATRARAEAEAATRRLTREGWQSYTAQQDEADYSFVYDSNQVTPLGDSPIAQDVTFSQPLKVRGETIGQLAVAGWKDIPPEAVELAAAVAAQASIHLETLRLTEELQKRADELQKLDRLKSDFLANMSHELRTPLNSILGFADVMLEELDGPLTENMNTDLSLIQKNGQHLLHLINDVLDMAKIEAGRMNLNPEKFKVFEILDEVIGFTSSLASEKNLALLIEEDSDKEVEIYADRTRLRQVMINLINNAIKFTETGKVSIKAVRMEDARVLIAVKDTGIGIPPDKLVAVFQEFIQVDSSTTRKAGGTGLGLPISRRLVAMHGGSMWAESTGVPGEGTTLFVELPLEAKLTEPVEKTEK